MKSLLIIFSLIFILIACSSVDETTKNTATESYVFDDTNITSKPEEKTKPAELPKTESIDLPQKSEFIVQLAAFSTEDRADQYIEEMQKNIKYNLIKKFNEKTKLFVIQISPFNSRTEAEKVRNELWKNEKFKDAFIVP